MSKKLALTRSSKLEKKVRKTVGEYRSKCVVQPSSTKNKQQKNQPVRISRSTGHVVSLISRRDVSEHAPRIKSTPTRKVAKRQIKQSRKPKRLHYRRHRPVPPAPPAPPASLPPRQITANGWHAPNGGNGGQVVVGSITNQNHYGASRHTTNNSTNWSTSHQATQHIGHNITRGPPDADLCGDGYYYDIDGDTVVV